MQHILTIEHLEPTVERPSKQTMWKWYLNNYSYTEATDGCKLYNHDNFCEHGYISWVVELHQELYV